MKQEQATEELFKVLIEQAKLKLDTPWEEFNYGHLNDIQTRLSVIERLLKLKFENK